VKVFDPARSSVVTAFWAPGRVTSLCHVVLAPSCTHGPLAAFHGCLAIGTLGGQVWLVDLRLHEPAVELPPPVREVASVGMHQAEQHAGLPLGYAGPRADSFLYTYGEQDGEEQQERYASQEVSVTAMAFFPEALSLAWTDRQPWPPAGGVAGHSPSPALRLHQGLLCAFATKRERKECEKRTVYAWLPRWSFR
jgi:hypothetical protein